MTKWWEEPGCVLTNRISNVLSNNCRTVMRQVIPRSIHVVESRSRNLPTSTRCSCGSGPAYSGYCGEQCLTIYILRNYSGTYINWELLLTIRFNFYINLVTVNLVVWNAWQIHWKHISPLEIYGGVCRILEDVWWSVIAEYEWHVRLEFINLDKTKL